MSGSHDTTVAASSSGSYATVGAAAHDLWRHSSVPAATSAPRGGGHHHSPIRSQSAPAARGVGAVARALWAWVARARRRRTAKERYGDEEDYAQNFDEGVAAMEPENLSRSFSARYAVRTRLAGTRSAVESGSLNLRPSRRSSV